ncbi:MAG: ISKra4 family transposase [Desulfobacterales bacterium]|nr:ISKra4 family transposase [Desulfobacterales bacterium]
MIAEKTAFENGFSDFSENSDNFSGAAMKFEEMINFFSSESQKLTHSEAESFLQTEGTELLRRMQGFLDESGLGNIGPVPEGNDGVERSRGRERSRQLESTFGRVSVKRLAYSAEGSASLHPKDARLSLPKELYSHELRRKVAREAAKDSFDEVCATIKEYTGAHVPKRQAEDLAKRAAADFDAFYEKRKCTDPEQAGQTGRILVLTTDGKGIAMRKEDLREATRKAAEKSKKLRKRLTKGEKRNRKRMATVASVYTAEPFERSPEDVVKELGPVREVGRKKQPRPESKRVWASIEKPEEKVIGEIFEEALRRDPDRCKLWTAVVDGEGKQPELIKKTAEKHGLAITYVLDIIHVPGYLWKAACVFHKEAGRDAEQWVSTQLLLLLQGRLRQVADTISQAVITHQIPEDKRTAADKCAEYLLKYKKMLRYDRYPARGLPIASGVIEGACRHLVKDRMDRTGARWRLEGGEAVLRLRALYVSGDFEEYWDFHLKCEHERNHATIPEQELQYENDNKTGGRSGRSHLRLVK